MCYYTSCYTLLFEGVDGFDFIGERNADIVFHGGGIGCVASGFGNDAALDAGSGHGCEIEVAARLRRQLTGAGALYEFPIFFVEIVFVHFKKLALFALDETLDDGLDFSVDGD